MWSITRNFYHTAVAVLSQPIFMPFSIKKLLFTPALSAFLFSAAHADAPDWRSNHGDSAKRRLKDAKEDKKSQKSKGGSSNRSSTPQQKSKKSKKSKGGNSNSFDESGSAEELNTPQQHPADIRFNKVPPNEKMDGIPVEMMRNLDGGLDDHLPLMPNDYPIGGEKLMYLRVYSMADSVVVPGDFQLSSSKGLAEWLNDPVVNPVYPGDSEGVFWDEMRKVVSDQLARRRGDDRSTLNTWPDIWDGMVTLQDVAMAVQGEYPAFWQQIFIEKCYQGGLEMYRDLGPFRCANDYVGRQARLSVINAWSFEVVSAENFMLKWAIGMPRPEEMAWKIHNDEVSDVPDDLAASIKSMNLQDAADFTAYENGCPNHPSYPAMHSAGSTVSFWLPAIAKITPEQHCEALRVDYAVAYARTIAGVHYVRDNVAGLNIGQRIILEKLPDFLEQMWGYDRILVAEKLQKLAFDWADFDPEACTIKGISNEEFLAMAGVVGI